MWRNADVATSRLPLPTPTHPSFSAHIFPSLFRFRAALTLSLQGSRCPHFHYSMGMSTGPMFSAFQKRRVQGLGGRGHLLSLLCTATVANALFFVVFVHFFVLLSLLWRKQKFSKKTGYIPLTLAHLLTVYIPLTLAHLLTGYIPRNK